MAWSGIAARNANKNATKKLIVSYTQSMSDDNQNEVKTDDIPRHKEITPDPADDFEMTNQADQQENNEIFGKIGKMVNGSIIKLINY